jgi:hypothetical protein
MMGNLVVQNINIWLGKSREGTSSGLHHDHHDNLYILLSGRKTFKLYSPDEIHRMYTYGDFVRIHPNGRINYRGEETRADGADVNAVRAQRAADALDRAAAADEEVAGCIVSAHYYLGY